MNFYLDSSSALRYCNQSQKIRVMSEIWVGQNLYCPICGNIKLQNLKNNMPVADFQCSSCDSTYELKSKRGSIGRKITDGEYSTMVSRITSLENPDLLIMQYSDDYQVTDLTLVPKFFFVPNIIEKRPPLAASARRAGWVGCNILYDRIPMQGRIKIIKQQNIRDASDVMTEYGKALKLRTNSIESRGWIMDVLTCINLIPSNEFSLTEVYKFADELQQRHIENHNVEAKIRQQLQLLRNKGFITFIGRGLYRKVKL